MRTAAYLREISARQKEAEKWGMEEQRERLEAYARAHGWEIERFYLERGQGEEVFRQLLQDGMNYLFDLVLVASVYRAGKSLWSANEVLNETLHYGGVGFAVAEDDFVSLGKSGEETDAYFFSKSQNLRCESAVESSQEKYFQGRMQESDVCYGYELSKEKRIVARKDTAEVVKRIFLLFSQGKSPEQVARMLTEEKTLSPKAAMGQGKAGRNPYLWKSDTVKHILKNPSYLGRRRKRIGGSELSYEIEPLVSEEVFWEAQQALQKRKRGKNKKEIFSNPEIVKQIRADLEEEKRQAASAAVFLEELGEAEKKRRIRELQKEAYSLILEIALREKRRVEEGLPREEEKMEELEAWFAGCRKRVQELERAFSRENPWVSLYQGWDSRQETTREALGNYAEQILVDASHKVFLVKKEERWKRELPESWRE